MYSNLYCCSKPELTTYGYLLRELIYKVINSRFRENFSTNIFLDDKHFMYIGGKSKITV